MTKIFLDTKNPTKDEKLKAILNYNSAIGKKIYDVTSATTQQQINSYYKEIDKLRNYVYTYYEYVQFKRAKFDCTKVEYNQQTGRMIRMEFTFTGKFE